MVWFAEQYLVLVLTGGPHAIMAILFVMISALVIERHRVINRLIEKTRELEIALEDYETVIAAVPLTVSALRAVLYDF